MSMKLSASSQAQNKNYLTHLRQTWLKKDDNYGDRFSSLFQETRILFLDFTQVHSQINCILDSILDFLHEYEISSFERLVLSL